MATMQRVVVLLALFLVSNYTNILIDAKPELDYHRYLQQFGYAPKPDGRRLMSILGKSTYDDGIKKFQRLYKLPETGELDARTRKFMERARCGNPDLGTVESVGQPVKLESSLTPSSAKKSKAPASYVAQNIVWPKKTLKWFIEEYPKNQKYFKSQDQVRRVFQQAFQDWEKYSGLKFEMTTNNKAADLKIKFQAKDHGDGYPFDGQGATLAHAFYPTSGDLHFDDDELFTDDYTAKDDQYTLRLVAAHEIGHSLGLAHSFEPESLMFPVYQQFKADYSISEDDRQGIQTLYGKPDSKTEVESDRTTATTTTTKSPSAIQPAHGLPSNNWCPGQFQTGCEGPDGDLYLFKDEHVWRYQSRSKRSWEPSPKLIRERFPPLSDTTITACVKSKTGYTYLFRNYRLWKLSTHWSVDGPHIIYGYHYPQNPRAALLHGNSIYLIRNRFAYRFNEFNHERELEIYNIESLLKPPPEETIRSGFTYKNRHYIFTRNDVYVYDSTNGKLQPGFPKAMVNGWFACEGASLPSNWNKKTPKPAKQAHRDNDEEPSRQPHFNHNHGHHRPHPLHHRHNRPRRPHHHHHYDD
ncbi:unnamed protein product [Adineta ricciae]|uniref:Peptidase metallopeptidase domain-containing protein n=1 Tax=Adineta ricciae TaxID=249248 RepID=A0A813Q3F8_ADIRI|nr:unnamed protein product [Adineta ricciae]CAF0919260.1 unnamed protein product [Adineta ricciae]